MDCYVSNVGRLRSTSKNSSIIGFRRTKKECSIQRRQRAEEKERRQLLKDLLHASDKSPGQASLPAQVTFSGENRPQEVHDSDGKRRIDLKTNKVKLETKPEPVPEPDSEEEDADMVEAILPNIYEGIRDLDTPILADMKSEFDNEDMLEVKEEPIDIKTEPSDDENRNEELPAEASKKRKSNDLEIIQPKSSCNFDKSLSTHQDKKLNVIYITKVSHETDSDSVKNSCAFEAWKKPKPHVTTEPTVIGHEVPSVIYGTDSKQERLVQSKTFSAMHLTQADSNVNLVCFVPMCKSTGRTTPGKMFIPVPKDYRKRMQWWIAARHKLPVQRNTYYCCEDHFDLREDLTNYLYVTMVGGKMKLKPGVVPHKFECYQGRHPSPNTS